MENVAQNDQPASGQTAGAQLRAAREALGLSRSDIASQTKVAERHLLAIEEDRLGDLAARTYAVGFARSYARAVGLNEAAIAERVRGQLDAQGQDRPITMPSFEPGDPARVPTVRLAWIAGGAVVVAIVLLLVFFSSYLSPEGTLPSLLPDETTAPAVAPRPVSAVAPAAPVAGPVVLTARADHVWIKVTDGAGVQVVQKELALGESWTVPDGATGATLRTGRPDALQITVGGRPVPALSDRAQIMGNVSLAASDLIRRITAMERPVPATQGIATGAPAPRSTSNAVPVPSLEPRRPASPPGAAAPAVSAPVVSAEGTATPLASSTATPLSTTSD
jgi:transcriptional regulator with XRE-family HTH domain